MPDDKWADTLQDFLVKVDLVADPASRTRAGATGADVIRSDALDMNKWTTSAIGSVGGLSAIAIGLKGFFSSLSSGTTIALVASAAGVIAVSAIAMAWVVTTDSKVRDRLERARIANRPRALHEFGFLLPQSVAESKGSGAVAVVPPTMAKRLGDPDDTRRVVLAVRWDSSRTEVLALDPLKKQLLWTDAGEMDQYFGL